MTTLRLEPIGGAALDLALLVAPEFTLWRRDGAIQLTLADDIASRVARSLAFGGVRARAYDGPPPIAPPALARAIGIRLDPVPLAAGELDLLEVRRIALAAATAELLRRRLPGWPLAARRRARCRALLRGEEGLVEVRRAAWCARSTLRAARRALRPTVFDRGAAPPALRHYLSDAPLARWAGG